MLLGITSPVKSPSRSLARSLQPPPERLFRGGALSPVKTYTVVLSPDPTNGGYVVAYAVIPLSMMNSDPIE